MLLVYNKRKRYMSGFFEKQKGLALLCLLAFILILGQPALAAPSAMLWRVEGKAGAIMYLMGSLHLATPSLYPLKEPIIEAFGESIRLAVEMDVSGQDQQALGQYVAQKGFYPKGQTLYQRLSPETLELIKPYRDTVFLNPKSTMRPWLVSISLQAIMLKKLGYDEELGLDVYFLNLAKKNSLEVVELETLEEQLGAFADMTPKEEELFLKASLIELDKLEEGMEELIAAWSKGDTEKFRAIFFEAYDLWPELIPLFHRLIDDRNYLMLERLSPYLERPGETTFAVIGTGHLVGPTGLPTLFEQKGYKVSQE
jgi:uncharacterized protein YbaP (TraB family)